MPEHDILRRQIDSDAVDDLEAWVADLFFAATNYFMAVLPLTASQLAGAVTPTDAERAEGYFTPRRALERRLTELQQAGNVDANKEPKTISLILMVAAMHSAMTRLTLGQVDADLVMTGKLLGRDLGLACRW